MSSPKDFRKRLDALNREPLPKRELSEADVKGIRRRIRNLRQESRRPAGEAILYRRDLPRSEGKADRPAVPAGPPIALEEAVKGTEVRCPRGGKAYLVVNRLDEREESWADLCNNFRDGLLREGSDLRRRLLAVCGAGHVQLEDAMFMDLESTGLAGTPLFLIGTMVWEEGGLVTRHYLARDYSEEGAVVSLFLDSIVAKKLLISFNGKAFDLPYVRVRAAANGIPFAVSTAHFDLLHECRRTWRHVLPDCKLQTLESRICGRFRHGDIPGSDIPEAYHAYVRSGNAVQIVQILEHNLLDLATLAELMIRLPAPGP